MAVHFKLPTSSIEPLFSALANVSPNKLSRVELKALSLLKNALYLELEIMLEKPQENAAREIKFKQLFEEERKKRNLEFNNVEQRTY